MMFIKGDGDLSSRMFTAYIQYITRVGCTYLPRNQAVITHRQCTGKARVGHSIMSNGVDVRGGVSKGQPRALCKQRCLPCLACVGHVARSYKVGSGQRRRVLSGLVFERMSGVHVIFGQRAAVACRSGRDAPAPLVAVRAGPRQEGNVQ